MKVADNYLSICLSSVLPGHGWKFENRGGKQKKGDMLIIYVCINKQQNKTWRPFIGQDSRAMAIRWRHLYLAAAH